CTMRTRAHRTRSCTSRTARNTTESGAPPTVPPIDTRVFPEARAVLDRLLGDLDARSPGVITEVHLFGSIALGDGRPGQSDIDLVLMRADGIDNAETMAALDP